MAKWGEGDPRWIVEERADATNVNNWHWTEKNATLWSKDKLKDLFTSVKIENSEMACEINSLSKIEGEASANNRKAKLIFFYEWNIVADWEGYYVNSDNKTKYKGTIEIPNLSEEHTPDDVDVLVSMSDSKQSKMKEFMRTEGVKAIRKAMESYIRLLKEEYSQGLILPTKDKDASVSLANVVKQAPKSTSSAEAVKTSQPINDQVKIQTKKLQMKEEFKCRANEIYNVFTDINMVRAFTHGSAANYEAQKGGKFSLFDGNISGNFMELILNEKIVMNWRYKQWPDEHYSVVTLEFREKEDCTDLVLNQTGIPHNFLENTEEGWRRFYWNAIKQTFGFGSSIF